VEEELKDDKIIKFIKKAIKSKKKNGGKAVKAEV
jgi:hypothetical protein